MVKLNAALALGMKGDRAGVPVFTEIIFDVADKNVSRQMRIAAANMLKDLKEKTSIKTFLKLIPDIDADIRNIALTALSVLIEKNDKSSIPVLKETLSWSNNVIRVYSLKALGKVGDDSVKADLRKAYRDEDPKIRMAAAEALAMLGDYGALEYLIDTLKADEGRKDAKETLEKIKAERNKPKPAPAPAIK